MGEGDAGTRYRRNGNSRSGKGDHPQRATGDREGLFPVRPRYGRNRRSVYAAPGGPALPDAPDRTVQFADDHVRRAHRAPIAPPEGRPRRAASGYDR